MCLITLATILYLTCVSSTIDLIIALPTPADITTPSLLKPKSVPHTLIRNKRAVDNDDSEKKLFAKDNYEVGFAALGEHEKVENVLSKQNAIESGQTSNFTPFECLENVDVKNLSNETNTTVGEVNQGLVTKRIDTAINYEGNISTSERLDTESKSLEITQEGKFFGNYSPKIKSSEVIYIIFFENKR